MSDNVKTLHYFPQHIADMTEFQAIAAAYDAELKLLWAALGTQYANQYFDTMDADTCSRWESIMGITRADSDTLANRRIVIKGKWASSLPYTLPRFHEVLKSMLGEGYYDLTVSSSAKTLAVQIYLAQATKTQPVYDLMRAMAPADMVVTVRIIYNRWSRFKGITWAAAWDSGADTWSDLKQNAKWQEE